jgi:sec-independent protein translocase protein TatC
VSIPRRKTPRGTVPTSPQSLSDKKKDNTILGHIKELRKRLINSVIAILITSVAAFLVFDRVFAILKAPLGQVELVFIEITEGVSVYVQVCLILGLLLAAPYILAQIVLFVLPALTKRERRMVYIVLPWIVAMFFGGVAFGYFVLIPPALQFLIGWGSDIATAQIRVGNYVDLVARLLLAIGLVFELPVMLTFLARIGVVTSAWLAKQRRIAIILAFVLAAVLTPTIDPLNQLILAGPLILLYEISIWLARLVQRKRPETEAVPVEAAKPG